MCDSRREPQVPFWETEANVEIFRSAPWSDAHLRERRLHCIRQRNYRVDKGGGLAARG
jgi:hypothetical protein